LSTDWILPPSRRDHKRGLLLLLAEADLMDTTAASLRSACGDPPAYTSKQIGHADVRFTLNVYTHAAEHREQLSETAREQYDEALQWAGMGSNDPEAVQLASKVATENPA
jgi:hypothetical protein